MTPKTIAIIGAGARGSNFAHLIRVMGDLAKVVAVAEPRPEYRDALVKDFGITADRTFESWHQFVTRPRMCDAVIVATNDRDHVGPAVACMEKGYDMLLEKPMAPTLEDCRAIEMAQRKSKAIVSVCHSLRYQKGFRKLKEIVALGTVGRLITLDQIEQVEVQHQAHSFVRGNWGNEGRGSFMLLAKSCHDLDYMAYLVDKPCLAVSSFGALTYFRPENAPVGSAARCTECAVESKCLYSAIRQYVQTNRQQWWANVVSADHSYEAHMEAIRTGQYGRCAWRCDNDVVDHQVVAMQFADDITATFTMTAFTHGGGRRIRVHGTEGEALFDEQSITLKTFADRNVQRIELGREAGDHGGGDGRVVQTWLEALHSRDDSQVVANAQESLKTHTIVFAAERSRREQRMVRLAEL